MPPPASSTMARTFKNSAVLARPLATYQRAFDTRQRFYRARSMSSGVV